MKSARPTRFGAIAAILRKDLTLYSRDLLFVFLTILSLVFFSIVYWVLPRDVDETISLGIHAPEMERVLVQMADAEDEGLGITWLASESEVREAVEAREIEAGLVFQEGFIARVASGRETTVTIYVRPNLPEEITGAMESMVREIAYAVAGYELPVSEPDEDVIVLGEDRAGDQVPFRDRLKPLYAFIILMLEAITLAALVSSEIQQRTVTAILSTPARVIDIILAKGVLGTFIAFSETLLILLVIQGYGPSPLIVVITVFMGAVLVTGIALLAGSAGRDLMATMLLGILMLIPLAIPAFSVLFPGEPAAWIRLLPSFGIVKNVFETTVNGAGWPQAVPHLVALGVWCVVFATAGAIVLKKRVETL